MTENDDDRAIVTAILALAHSLRLGHRRRRRNQGQFAVLASLGCDQAQATSFRAPVPASDIAARYFGANTARWLRRRLIAARFRGRATSRQSEVTSRDRA